MPWGQRRDFGIFGERFVRVAGPGDLTHFFDPEPVKPQLLAGPTALANVVDLDCSQPGQGRQNRGERRVLYGGVVHHDHHFALLLEPLIKVGYRVGFRRLAAGNVFIAAGNHQTVGIHQLKQAISLADQAFQRVILTFQVLQDAFDPSAQGVDQLHPLLGKENAEAHGVGFGQAGAELAGLGIEYPRAGVVAGDQPPELPADLDGQREGCFDTHVFKIFEMHWRNAAQ